MDSSPANDALLVQLVSGALGRSVSSVEERDGVEAVTNKLRVI